MYYKERDIEREKVLLHSMYQQSRNSLINIIIRIAIDTSCTLYQHKHVSKIKIRFVSGIIQSFECVLSVKQILLTATDRVKNLE